MVILKRRIHIPFTEKTPVDPRILRTKESLQNSLLELCRTQDFASLSISNIVDAAGVNRSTFYQHYADKETLLADALDTYVTQAQAQLDAASADGLEVHPRDLILRYFLHVRDNIALYQTALSSSGPPVIVERLIHRVSMLAERGLAAQPAVTSGKMPVNIAAASLAGSFVGILREWINMTPVPSAENATDWAWAVLTTPVGEP
jgi:AcrR family transcriptional regulator